MRPSRVEKALCFYFQIDSGPFIIVKEKSVIKYATIMRYEIPKMYFLAFFDPVSKATREVIMDSEEYEWFSMVVVGEDGED